METVSENPIEGIGLEVVCDPAQWPDELERVATDARTAFFRASQTENRQTAFERIHTDLISQFEGASATEQEAHGDLTKAAAEGRATANLEDAFARAAFSIAVIKARLVAVAEAHAELERDITGDERLLGTLGKLGRRGRPKTTGGIVLDELKGSLFAGKSDRTVANAGFTQTGLSTLQEWNTNRDSDLGNRKQQLLEFYVGRRDGSGKQRIRLQALIEIGRISRLLGAKTAIMAAGSVFDELRKANKRPSTKEVAANLRNLRFAFAGKERGLGEDGLRQKLVTVIEEHRRAFPDITDADIVQVMQQVQSDLNV